MTAILGIDPGTERSAFVYYIPAERRVLVHQIVDNPHLEALLKRGAYENAGCVIEMVASYGMPVGREVFETVYWIGRFALAWEIGTGKKAYRIYRKDIKAHFCASMPKAKDANVWQALLDEFGPGKDVAVGTKKQPGPLYGIHSHERAALAVAVAAAHPQTRITGDRVLV